MYRERVIELSGLFGKNYLTITSDKGDIDFNLKTTLVKVYFDDALRKRDIFFAELRVYANNQANMRAIEVEVPKGAQKATIIFSTNREGYDLNKIVAVA